jgi:hypothetical protein
MTVGIAERRRRVELIEAIICPAGWQIAVGGKKRRRQCALLRRNLKRRIRSFGIDE